MTPIRVLITGPSLRDQGGVANYYNAVLPFLKADSRFAVEYCEIGSTRGSSGKLHVLADQARFRHVIRTFSPSIVHVNPSLTVKSFFRDGAFVHHARQRKIPVMVFFRGWDRHMEARIDRYLNWFFRVTYGRADASLVLASRFREKLREWGVSTPIETETTTVPDGFLKDFSIAEKMESIRSTPVVKILFMARLEHAKGVIETMEAVMALRQAGAPVSLTIAGDGPARNELGRMLDRSGAHRGFIELAGYVRDQQKRDLLTSHHIYCFPSDYAEGMPNSVLEAMAFGMPVITCAVGGLTDFFENGRMGYLVARRDTASIAEKLGALARDRVLASSISNFNYGYAIRRFLASDVAARLTKRYLALSDSSTARSFQVNPNR